MSIFFACFFNFKTQSSTFCPIFSNFALMTDNSQYLKAAYFTLGCKLNFAETSTIGKMLAERGISRAAKGRLPTFASSTLARSRKWPTKGAKAYQKPGCPISRGNNRRDRMLRPAEAAGGGRTARSGHRDRLGGETPNGRPYRRLACRQKKTHGGHPFRDIKAFHPSCEKGDRTRYFLKVQDGCDYFCTYCTIPFARGRSRSGMIPDLVAMAATWQNVEGRRLSSPE